MTALSWRLRALTFATITFFIPLSLPLGAQGRSSPPGSSSGHLDTAAILASARPEIMEANAAWLPGLRHRDAEAIAAAYADSGLFIGPDGVVTRGRDAVRAMYVARFPRLREILAGGVVQDGITVAGPDLVYEWGHGWIEMMSSTPAGPPVRSGGGYLTVWQRQPNGHWRIIRNLAF